MGGDTNLVQLKAESSLIFVSRSILRYEASTLRYRDFSAKGQDLRW